MWYREGVTLIHSDRHNASLWDYALPFVAMFAIIQGLGVGNPLYIIIGVAAGIYVLYTRHKRYDLFPHALVIHYMGPRMIVVPLIEVLGVIESRQPYAGVALMVQRQGSRNIVIKPADRAAFLSRMREALEAQPRSP